MNSLLESRSQRLTRRMGAAAATPADAHNCRARCCIRSLCRLGRAAIILVLLVTGRAADATRAGALSEFVRTAALRAAVNANNLERVGELLHEHPEWVSAINLEGDTPLHEAATKGYSEMATLLLMQGAGANATNGSAHTPLHAAALSGHAALASLLVTNGADLEMRCVRGMSPLFEAAEQGYPAVVQTLLAHGARAEGWNLEGDTTLHLAAQGGYLEIVRVLLDRSLPLDQTNHLGQTPLCAAATRGQFPVVECLVQHGADVLWADAMGETPIEAADRARYPEIARYLRQHWERKTKPEHDPRLTVAVLPLVNATGNTNDGAWGQVAPGAVARALDQMSSLRLSPLAAIEFAHRQLRLQPGDRLTPAQVRQVGELVEARRVVWGEYRRARHRWVVEMHVMTTATGKVSRRIVAQAANWYDVRDLLVGRLTREFRVRPSLEERSAMKERVTDTLKALDLLSQAEAAHMARRPVAEIEELIQRALLVEPANPGIRLLLATCRSNAGKLAEAEHIARDVVLEHPDSVEAWQMLGVAALLQGRPTEAERALRESLRLGPSESESLSRLAQVHLVQGRPEAALFRLRQASRLNPWDAAVHSSLASGFVGAKDPAGALSALKEFERLDADDENALQIATIAYAGLGDVPRAVECGDKFLRQSRELGLNPELLAGFAEWLTELRQRLVATPVVAHPPKGYTPQELQQALAIRLSLEERQWVVNPIEDSPSMQAWARELTANAPDDTAKARALFDALNRRIQFEPGFGARTAREVYADWLKAEEVFSCQEFAKLYVALARAVGLEAYLVHLELDYQDKPVYHDCAGVFLEGQCFLADPAYRWFGVPHKSLAVLDDLAVIAHHLEQHQAGETNLARARVGAKLQPDFPWGQLALARALTTNERFEEAGQALGTAQQLEPDRWDYFQVRGLLAARQQRYGDAIRDLNRSLELNPENGGSHLLRAQVLSQLGQWEDARDAFRASLRCPLSPEAAKEAWRGLAAVDELLGHRPQ